MMLQAHSSMRGTHVVRRTLVREDFRQTKPRSKTRSLHVAVSYVTLNNAWMPWSDDFASWSVVAAARKSDV